MAKKGYYRHEGFWYPEYPNLGVTVAKLRNGDDRKAHGNAVLDAIRALNRRLHMRPAPARAHNWYKPPSITRLLHYDKPLPMHGDPAWGSICSCRRSYVCKCDHWGAREKAVYAAAMEEKRARS
jgi:hypothetical protein